MFLKFCSILKLGDYKEGYYIGVEVAEDAPEAEKPFYGPNVWPAPGNYWSLFLMVLRQLMQVTFVSLFFGPVKSVIGH